MILCTKIKHLYNGFWNYKYLYIDYSWLTASEYGETDALTSNKDRYTEKMTSFARNGGIKSLQRYGKQSSGTYGYVDDLSISYSGNRIAGVSDGAPVVTQNGSMDFPRWSTPRHASSFKDITQGISHNFQTFLQK